MAQKRMFDRAIIDTDRFMDLSMSSKALYFLLGMEADDEGFVSYKKVMRIHGGNEDDVKVLMAKEFLISFKSGVVVITDWNKNNYLQANRIRPTEYVKEKKSLSLTKSNKYVLNIGLTRGEESSIVESSRVERIKPKRKPKPENSISYLKKIPTADLNEFVKRFGVNKEKINSKAEDLINYCSSHGKRYSNYKSFLVNALKKDFGDNKIKTGKYAKLT